MNDPAFYDRRRLFDELYNSTFSDVFGYCRRRTRSNEDAHDAVADIYVVAWRKLDVVTGAERPTAWLIAVARGVLANQRRHRDRGRRLLDRLVSSPARESLDSLELAESNAQVEAVLVALSSLRPLDRELVTLAAFEGLSYDDIGQVVKKRPAVVKTRLYRGRKELRRAIGDIETDAPVDRTAPSTNCGRPSKRGYGDDG